MLDQLKNDEITALKVPFRTVLENLANGDGSSHSVIGQGIVLQGLLLSLAPQIQKIGVNDLAKQAIAWLDNVGKPDESTDAALVDANTLAAGSAIEVGDVLAGAIPAAAPPAEASNLGLQAAPTSMLAAARARLQGK